MARFLFRFLAIMLLLIPVFGFGQIPTVITYQGLLTDDIGTPLNSSETLTFRLYDNATVGTPLWQEEQSVSIDEGLFRVLLGSVAPFPDNVRFDKPYWLSIQVGQSPEFDRVPLTSVGYSFFSSKADSADKIPDNTITRNKIADGEVTENKIRDGAVTQGKLGPGVSAFPNGPAGGALAGSYPNPTIGSDAVNSNHIMDEPGIAYKEKLPGFATLTSTSDPQPWDTLSIHVPGPGTVVVEASGFVTVRHTNQTRDVVVVNVFDDLTDLANRMFTHGASSFIVPRELPSSFFYRQSFFCRKAFSTLSETTLTFYLVIQQSEGANIGSTDISYTVLQATYYPTSYNSSTSSFNLNTRFSTPDRFGSSRR